MDKKNEGPGGPMGALDINGAGYEQSANTGFLRSMSIRERLMCVKPIEMLEHEAGKDNVMKRSLNALDLACIGIGAIIGTGIFVLTGITAATMAGPAVVLSFVFAGITAGLAGLCYAEMASMIPVSGSAYTYTYATMGEAVAWTIGWDLILEYLIGSSTVAVGWSAYFRMFFEDHFNFKFDPKWSHAPFVWDIKKQAFEVTGNYVDLPAMCIVAVCTCVLCFGIKQSSIVNNIVVGIKLTVIIIFIIAGLTKVDPDNWKPFMPENTSGIYGNFGVTGVLKASTTVFFAYIGFDAVSTTAQEAKNPQRDLPIGIITALTVCTTLYILASLTITGMVPYLSLNVANPIAYAASQVQGLSWLSTVVSVGAVCGLTSVLLITLMSQPRIFYAMSKDGLFPEVCTRLNRYQVPHVTTGITGVVCALCAGVLPIDILSELVSVGTLFAFLLVCLNVVIMRVRRPEIPRLFMVPGGPYIIPLLGAGAALALICIASPQTILRLVIWMAVGLVIYGFYGFRRSRIQKHVRSN